VLNDALYAINLSEAEEQKQLEFNKVEERSSYLTSILNNLTRDDVRLLMITEDELSRLKWSKRIFPRRSLAKYIPLVESSNYYYKLLDAWEVKYGENRTAGRRLLEDLSQQFL